MPDEEAERKKENKMALLEVRNLHKSFGDLNVLGGVDLDIDKGNVVAILGPSGSGKTTMLRCMNFLETADEGTMYFEGKEYRLSGAKKKEILELRLHTGFVFQSYNLFANKTVLQNVTMGLTVVRKMPKEAAEKKAIEELKKVGMEDRMEYFPAQLSGGQQQRVAIARALATDPDIIYFDEPTSALDPELTGEVLDVMKKLALSGMTMAVVTHEISFARDVSSHVVFIEKGKIVEKGPSAEFFANPHEERTREFLRMNNM